MLYIFLVDNGSMLNLDVDLALKSVAYLRSVIASAFGIQETKQVLLISGGESLEGDRRVCNYNAGTDTNPIFLFSMTSIESAHPPDLPPGDSEGATTGDSGDLLGRVEASARLPVSQASVTRRTALAQEFVKASQEQIAYCERVIHDQHLQHQGWLAVVANVEDTASELLKKNGKMVSNFRDYLERREEYREMVETFDDDVALLHQIPVFPSLLEAGLQQSMAGSVILDPPGEGGRRSRNKGTNGAKPQSEHRTAPTVEKEEMSLLEWISTRGSSQSLDQIADGCYRTIEGMDEKTAAEMDRVAKEAAALAAVDGKKEIRGVSERLQTLEKLLNEARRLAQEQRELAQSLLQTQQRAVGLPRESAATILPDLCDSHKTQLRVMSKNYQDVSSIRKRCASSKLEMCALLHGRMKWVVGVQNRMAEAGQCIVMYAEELKRFRRKMEVIEQLHTAPSMYIATAVEVVRRRSFSSRYLDKAGDLSEKFTELHDGELHARNTFQAKLKKHFLSKMFPGMEDLPPEFATQRPEEFDDRLPHITLSDVERLRRAFPDLARSLRIPEGDAMAALLARSINQELAAVQADDDDRNLLSLKNINARIRLNEGGEVNSVSMIGRVVGGDVGIGGGRRKQRRGDKAGSASRERAAATADSDSDSVEEEATGGARTSRNGRRKDPKKKLTQSLPLDDSCLVLEPREVLLGESAADKESSAVNDGSGYKADLSGGAVNATSANAVSSSSAGEPATTSSSTAHTGNSASSVVPSSDASGSGSVLKHQQQHGSTIMDTSSTTLAAKLAEAEAGMARLRLDLKSAVEGGSDGGGLGDTRRELQELRGAVLEEREKFLGDIKAVVQLVEKLKEASARELSEQCAESSALLASLESRLELESHKLEDCHAEIEMYRGQLHSSAVEGERARAEMQEEREAAKKEWERRYAELEQDAEETRRKMLLEHEFEVDALKESLRNPEAVRPLEEEVSRLRAQCEERDDTVAALKKKTRLLENAQEEKFHAEKDKIVRILEAGFAERERLAVAKAREEERAEAKREAEEESKAKEEEEGRRREERAAEAVEEARKGWEEEKAKVLKQQEVELTIKAKKELETLRSRFKMMHTAGSLARSPSSSESELPIGSPKTDLLESLRSTVAAEHDSILRSERARFEERMEAAREEHRAEVERVKNRERNRETAGQQVAFNEALKKAVDERDRAVEAKKKSEEEEKRRAEETSRLQEANRRLEAELEELRRGRLTSKASTSSMNSSVCPATPPPKSTDSASSQAAKLQQENDRLRAKLTSSMHEHLRGSPSAVVVDGAAETGDRVMIVWSEEHRNFALYSEGPHAPLNFLHSDSLGALKLSLPPSARRYATAEVTEKEYCQAKKAENRFRVPQGTKFYRVKCKPIKDEE